MSKENIDLGVVSAPTKSGLVKWVKQWFDRFALGCKAIVYVSGTCESSVCAALFTEALGKENVIGIVAPNLKQQNINETCQLIDVLGIESYTIPISVAVASIHNQMEYEGISVSSEAAFDLPERVRASVLHAIAQSMNGRVVDAYNSPIGGLSKEEIISLGRELRLPENLICEQE